jgi:hypothetical protein
MLRATDGEYHTCPPTEAHAMSRRRSARLLEAGGRRAWLLLTVGPASPAEVTVRRDGASGRGCRDHEAATRYGVQRGLLRQLRTEAGPHAGRLAGGRGAEPRSVGDLERGISRTALKDTAVLLSSALSLWPSQPAPRLWR